MYVRGGAENIAAMLFLFLLAAACAASNGPGFPQCKTAGWEECVPATDKLGIVPILTSGNHACVMCEAINKGDASGSPFPFLSGADGVAIRGYPFHVLSAKSLTPPDPSVVHTLALIDAKITDVENNTFAGFTRLERLSLDSNRLTNVKQTWFTGLEKLLTLILSNNHIKQIDPRSFMHLTRLNILDLENNLLQVVDPAWLFGLKCARYMYLGLNEISSISPGSFQHLQLNLLDLNGNDLSCLDGELLRGQSFLSNLHISSGMLSSIHDSIPHGLVWSLRRLASTFRGSATMVVEVPKFLFCVSHRRVTHELSFGWMFDSLDNVPRYSELGAFNPESCGALGRSLSTISIQTPVVVLATDDTLADKLVPDKRELCRQVWEYNRGITVTVGQVGTPTFQLVSLAKGNTTFEGVAMSFVQTQGRNALTTESGCSQTHTALTNATYDNTQNITCILLTKDEHMELFLTVPKVQSQTHTTTTAYRTETEHPGSPTHYTKPPEKRHTFLEPGDTSTLQVSNTPGLEVPPGTDHVLISVVVSVVVSLAVMSLTVLVWKLCSARSNTEDESASDDAHIWIIPPGVVLPGLLRSASLPACPRKLTSDDAASCRSLPAVLQSIEPTYCGIPDDIAAAHRPLPGIPHIYTEIPDDAISGAVRSSSLPAVTCRGEGAADDSASCRSLPAVLLSIEPVYSEIPDQTAVAQRPLPALPRTAWEIPDHEAAARCPLFAQQHTYSEIPDDESGPMPFYADASASLHVVANRRPQRLTFRDNTVASSRNRSERSFATYGSAEETKAESNDFYRKAPEVQGIRSRRQLRAALVSQSADQGLRKYINVTDAILSRGQNVTEAHIAFLTMHDAHRPWEMSGEGTRITPRRVSFPYVTLPNTYWPWEIPGDGTPNRSRRLSLPYVTLPNTYWPCDIPGEETRNTPRRDSLPLVTLPNTYWTWEIPGDGTGNISRRASFPDVTLPNTYCP
ncbi:LRIG3 [Branchiostoma lanceolatum]|uniref:LRIG3 protein n=1 Tax=Branchiostoma lanceolatum TaxID=7740 RepID=A0A8K0EA69_BRALA|nr:LRIG3 [Branchiostoma lanceolatum]